MPFAAGRGYDGPRVVHRSTIPTRRTGANPNPMSAISEAAVLDALRTVQEPELGGDLVTRNMIRDLVIDGADVAFTIELTTPACPLKDQIESEVRQALDPIGVQAARRSPGARPSAAPRRARRSSSCPASRT